MSSHPLSEMFGVPASDGRDIIENVRQRIEHGIDSKDVADFASVYDPESMYLGAIIGISMTASTYGHMIQWESLDEAD